MNSSPGTKSRLDVNRPVFLGFPSSIQNLIRKIVASGLAKKIVLFGSRARGTSRENSDFDFAVSVTDRGEWSKFCSDLDQEIITLLPYDLVIYDELSEDYRRRIDTEGIVVYE